MLGKVQLKADANLYHLELSFSPLALTLRDFFLRFSRSALFVVLQCFPSWWLEQPCLWKVQMKPTIRLSTEAGIASIIIVSFLFLTRLAFYVCLLQYFHIKWPGGSRWRSIMRCKHRDFAHIPWDCITLPWGTKNGNEVENARNFRGRPSIWLKARLERHINKLSFHPNGMKLRGEKGKTLKTDINHPSFLLPAEEKTCLLKHQQIWWFLSFLIISHLSSGKIVCKE